MPAKLAKADITPVRQRSQYTCMAASLSMALKCHGQGHCDEDTVNKVMGAQPMRGASWEQALACAQHYGMRGTLTSPCTLKQLKAWTDAGTPVLIAWNPEGREWSHASLVFDVDEDENVHVADPNIPDPEQTVRVVPKSEFYAKWYEKWPDYLVRRPAMAIEREITPDGRQVMAGYRRAKNRMGLVPSASEGLTQPLMTRRDYGSTTSMKAKDYAAILKYAVNLPADVERYVEEVKENNPSYSEGQAWATAWSIYCKYKNPNSEHCKQDSSDYFPGRTAKFPAGESMTVDEVADVVGPEFKEMNKNPPPEVVKVRKEMEKKALRYPLIAMDTFAEMLRDGKFEKGKSMTVDEVAEVVGPEFKEMNEDPPESVKKLRKDMEGKTAAVTAGLFFNRSASKERNPDARKMTYEDFKKVYFEGEPVKDSIAKEFWSDFNYAFTGSLSKYIKETSGKTAAVTAGGKYGFTKSTETACTAGVNKLQKAAKRIANALYAKDEGSVAFLQKHAAKGGSKTASMLLKAMEDIGPAAMLRAGKTAGKSGNGLYGFSEKTAKLGLDACSALHHEAGVIAADMFARKGADPVKVAGYLAANAKKGKCAFSAMLAEVAPDAMEKVAAKKPAKPDTDFVVEEDDGIWSVIGKPSKFVYSAHGSEAEAEKAKDEWLDAIPAKKKKKATDFLASDESDDELINLINEG